MNDVVYLVTAGSYWDYRVVAVFSTMDKAKAFISWAEKKGAESFNDIEIYPIDPMQIELSKGYNAYTITMLRNGDVKYAKINKYPSFYSSTFIARPPGGVQYLVSDVWAKDKKHAIKITNEKRAQLIANGEWA